MATATNPTPTPAIHSLRDSVAAASVPLSSAQSRRSSEPLGLSSPWTQIVHGGESESGISALSSSPPLVGQEQTVNPSLLEASAAAGSASPEEPAVEALQLENSDNGNGRSSNNAAKKPAWNKPSNGAVDVSPVMDALSWPALSESTKASPKSSSSDSLKALSDGSVSVTQGTGIPFSSSPKQVNTNNGSANSTPNHVGPTLQRSMKRGGANSSNSACANGGYPQPAQGPLVEVAPSNSRKLGNSESSSGDNSRQDGVQKGGFGSQSLGGNENQQQRNLYRRGNGGRHSLADGSCHHGYGGRRDQECGNQDWNPHRVFGGRDAHMQPQRVPVRPFLRGPPPASPPFISPPLPVRPIGTPMVYPEFPPPVFYVPGLPPDSIRMPMLAPMQTVFFHVPDPQLHSKLVSQIDYYFSNENLIKDTFLRQNMDDQGWVHVNLIAAFKKVMQLTDNIQLILDAVRSSTVVEVQGEKLRRRNDWMRWIMPASVRYSAVSSQSQQKSSSDLLPGHLRNLSFDEKTEHANVVT